MSATPRTRARKKGLYGNDLELAMLIILAALLILLMSTDVPLVMPEYLSMKNVIDQCFRPCAQHRVMQLKIQDSYRLL